MFINLSQDVKIFTGLAQVLNEVKFVYQLTWLVPSMGVIVEFLGLARPRDPELRRTDCEVAFDCDFEEFE